MSKLTLHICDNCGREVRAPWPDPDISPKGWLEGHRDIAIVCRCAEWLKISIRKYVCNVCVDKGVDVNELTRAEELKRLGEN